MPQSRKISTGWLAYIDVDACVYFIQCAELFTIIDAHVDVARMQVAMHKVVHKQHLEKGGNANVS